MELVSKKRLYLVSGRNNIPLAEDVWRIENGRNTVVFRDLKTRAWHTQRS